MTENLKAQAEVEQVLSQLPGTDMEDAAQWDIRSLGQGEQAQLYLANCEQSSNGPSIGDVVVVKLYKDSVASDRAAFQSEQDGLRVLSELLRDSSLNGVRMRSPALIRASDDPMALVMDRLPGVSLDVWLRSNELTTSSEEAIAAAILSVLEELWSHGKMYGDINLKNILYDPTEAALGFIDPGLPSELYRCSEVSKDCYPMSRDIAYLLFSVAVSFKSTLGNRGAWQRQRQLVSLLAKRYVESMESKEQQAVFLEEVRGCMERHLQTINCSWSPSGIWRRFVRQITHSRMKRMIHELAPVTRRESM